MPLDPHDLLRQIEAAAPELKVGFNRLAGSIEEALAIYRAAEAAHWQDFALRKQAEYALGYPLDGLHQNRAVEEPPSAYTVVATDGSVIPPDRHNGTALYHVINTGRVMLRYGAGSQAELDSRTRFYAGDVSSEEEQESSAPLVIDLKRDLAELAEGFDLAQRYEADLMLMDGPLTMWTSRDRTGDQVNKIRQDYYATLEAFKVARIPIVGYISNTHSQGVTNSLRLLRLEQPQATLFDLPDDPPQSVAATVPKARAKRRDRPTGLTGVQDAMLFERLLGPDHYSEVFKTAFSEPKELAAHIEEICFVYWRTPQEVVRLEFPQWVAEAGLLPRVASLVYEQYRRGQGYPVALMEAHESAVLRQADRELLRILLEERGLLQAESEKGRSKRLRGI